MKRKTLAIWMMLLVVALVLAGCGTVTPPASNEPTQEPEALPLPEEAEATAFVTGGSVSGTVFWGQTPLPGALVELRADDWRVTGDETVIAQAEAGPDGQFVISDVPAGEWSVLGRWPGGELSEGGTPVVTVSEGQGITDVVVRLERAITLLEPDLSQPGNLTPAVRWEALAGLDSYRVLLIDMGTSEAVVEEMVEGDSLTVAEGALEPSRIYTLVISGFSQGEPEPLASFTGEYRTVEAP